jgi:peptidoglycan hydrolase-like protein with peptidoglycan-binding domain
MKRSGIYHIAALVIGTSLVVVVPLFNVPAQQSDPSAASQAAADQQRERVRRIQQALIQFGYKPGAPDGVMGGRTRRAIRYYQGDYGLKVDGEPSAEVLAHMEESLQARGIKPSSGAPQAATEAAEQAAQPPDPGEDQQTWETGLIVEAVTLKLEPKASAEDGAALAANTSVEITGRDAGWLEVAGPRGETGWVHLSAVKLDNTEPEAAEHKPQGGGGFVQGLARGLTGLFGGGNAADTGGATTATIGIRGLSKEGLAAAQPTPAELAKMEDNRASPEAARAFASERKLAARSVEYLPEPVPVQTGGNGGPGFSGGRK